MSKVDKLKRLDELVLDKMIEWMEEDTTERLPELTSAITFLRANQVVESAKTKDTDPVEVRKQKLEEAKKRREDI